MKFSNIVISCFVFMLSKPLLAQEVIHITPEQLLSNIKATEGKATIVQFWVPNCDNALDIVNNYKALESRYSPKVDFYFIGITNKDSLVTSLLKNSDYKHNIYVADASVHEDIYERKLSFCNEFCKLIYVKEEEFITLYMDTKDEVKYLGDAIEVEEKKIRRILEK